MDDERFGLPDMPGMLHIVDLDPSVDETQQVLKKILQKKLQNKLKKSIKKFLQV
jgi:hypothetical protein